MTFYDAGAIDANGNPINFHYQIATFKDGTQLYQVIDSSGAAIGFFDMDGNPITVLPAPEYGITDTFPPRPSWGT